MYNFCMTIYIESFLIQNLIINLCLLRLVEITTKSKSSFFKITLASLLGASFSVISAIFLKNAIFMNILKIFCACLMLIIAFKTKWKGFLFNLILLFVYTYAFGGAVIGLSSSTYLTEFGVIMSSKINLGIITLIIIILTYIFQLVSSHIKSKINLTKLIYTLTLHLNKQKLKINAFLDTGNRLTYMGKPVIIIDLDSYLHLTKQNLIEFYTSKTDEISLGTVAGLNKMKIIKIDSIEVNLGKKKKILTEQYVAVNTTNSFKGANYDALLAPNLI